MRNLALIASLLFLVLGCGVGTNYQEVKERQMKTDPCYYERMKGAKAEERCQGETDKK